MNATAEMNRSGVLDMIPDDLSVCLTDDQAGCVPIVKQHPNNSLACAAVIRSFENLLGPPVLTG